ncbi:flagellar assembly protein FliH [Halalkalibacter akibai]|uniref:Flagellar assembly protein FliH n=1 Tax=Halalkalibacter akibai (strain ATCC 43226 / DSM 21942 / CIP 109018 / JCM 9157 / 1139) TaxID=1236973 RepID=W4QV57_HALA3|nr:flagellar assembly protein FliH [Halalkalibacter akibai]GAE36025.1 flagellar assembly protein FliH [Halalkalibacter akibai JCM 9157]
MSKIIKSLYSPSDHKESKQILIKNLFEEGIYNKKDSVGNRSTDEDEQVDHFEEIKAMEEQLEEAQARAEQLIAEANDQARAILEQAELERQQSLLEIEQLKQEALEQGYQEGFETGQQEGFQSYSVLIEQAQGIVAHSEQEFEKTVDSAQPVIVELATALAKRMLDLQFSEMPEIWSALLKQVMSEVREHENVRIYVHPDWFERTSHQKEELEQLLSHTENLFIYPDAGLMKNGCVIESKYGRIEATVDKQLEELKLQLLEKLKEGEHERRGSY